MRFLIGSATVAAVLTSAPISFGQDTTRTLVAVWAHADDEAPVGPVLARYAREGVQVHTIIATDGSQGAANTSLPRGPEIAKLRVAEANCSSQALGIHPPVLLGFPDAALGYYQGDPSMLFRLTQRVQEELQRLQPDVLITWGPDGGYGHPDHRIVSSIVSQLARAGAPGAPPQVFYGSIPAEGFRAMNPSRGAPPFTVPRAELFTVRVPFTDADFESARRSMLCHKTQMSDEAVERTTDVMRKTWNGVVPLSAMEPEASERSDLFR